MGVGMAKRGSETDKQEPVDTVGDDSGAGSSAFSAEDIDWTYQNLQNPNPDASTAPSTGAINLHAYYSQPENRGKFFEKILTTILPKQKRSSEAQREFVGAKQIEQCDDMLKKLKVEAEQDAGK